MTTTVTAVDELHEALHGSVPALGSRPDDEQWAGLLDEVRLLAERQGVPRSPDEFVTRLLTLREAHPDLSTAHLARAANAGLDAADLDVDGLPEPRNPRTDAVAIATAALDGDPDLLRGQLEQVPIGDAGAVLRIVASLLGTFGRALTACGVDAEQFVQKFAAHEAAKE